MPVRIRRDKFRRGQKSVRAHLVSASESFFRQSTGFGSTCTSRRITLYHSFREKVTQSSRTGPPRVSRRETSARFVRPAKISNRVGFSRCSH